MYIQSSTKSFQAIWNHFDSLLYIENMTILIYSLLSNSQGLFLYSALGFYIKYRSEKSNDEYTVFWKNNTCKCKCTSLSMLGKVFRMDSEIISTFTFKHFFLVLQNSNMITFTNILLVLFMALVQVNWMHMV